MDDQISGRTEDERTKLNRRSLLKTMGGAGFGSLLSASGSSAATGSSSNPWPSFVDWDYTFGGQGNDRIESVVETEDGGYVFAGGTASFDSEYYDGWLVKVDSAGTKQWQRTFGNENLYSFNDMIQTEDGGFAFTGSTQIDVNRSYPWILKTDSEGIEEWQTLFDEYGILTGSLVETSDNGYILTGRSGGPSWIGKVDGTGEQEWQKQIHVPSNKQASHFPRDIIRTLDDGLVICGSGYVQDIQTDSFGWLAKLDEKGDYTITTFSDVRPFTFIQTTDGGFLLGGNSISPSYGNFLLMKTDQDGNEVWSRTFGGSRQDLITSIIETDHGFTLSGHTNSYDGNQIGYRGWLATTDSVGKVKWQAVFPNRSYLNTAIPSSDGGYVLGGFNRANYTEDGRLLKVKSLDQKPDFHITYSPETLSTNEPITFEASSSTKFVRYEWDFDNQSVISNSGQPITITYPEGGKRQVTLRAVTEEGWREVIQETLLFPIELGFEVDVEDIAPALYSQGHHQINVCITISDINGSQNRIDVETLRFGTKPDLEVGNGFPPVKIREGDVDGDGDTDLVLDFEFSLATLRNLAEEVYLVGECVDGVPVIGSSTIQVQ